MAVRDPDINLDDLQFTAGTEPQERYKALAALITCRWWYAKCRQLKRDFLIGWEQVDEKGTRGPGRNMRMTLSWINDEGNRVTRVAYPKGLGAAEFATSQHLHLEHGAQSF